MDFATSLSDCAENVSERLLMRLVKGLIKADDTGLL
tara:strand:+ start:150 stop:257 length:108 start_codon:yes stop_codon:yes gene_type:complete